MPLEAKTYTAYERSNPGKPEKIVARLTLNPAQLVGDLNIALSSYDEVFAVDTNTKQIDGQIVAVMAVLRCRFAKPSGTHIAFSCSAEPCLEIRNPTVSPERLGWRIVLDGIQRSAGFDKVGSVALVVDAFLDDHPVLQRRERAILGDFFLPPKCDLVYASADVKGNGIANHLVSACDRFAALVLRALEKNPSLKIPLTPATSAPFESFRYWDVLPDETAPPRPGEKRCIVTPRLSPSNISLPNG